MAGLFMLFSAGALILASPASAHVSEQGLVLLLPTGHYITSGVLSVVASIILISLTPKTLVERLFKTREIPRVNLPLWVADATSLAGLAGLIALVTIGIIGPRDPLTNLFPLAFWVGFWIILFSVIGLTFDLWRYINPWSGLCTLLLGRNAKGLVHLPEGLGAWPGLAVFLAFAGFYVADPAPTDPDWLAQLTIIYWGLTFAAMTLFGPDTWRKQGEAFSILFSLIARCAPFGRGTQARIGVPGWDLLPDRALSLSLGVFAIVILGVGSFDGLKETFWWLGLIDVNPLEFPGRSFVIGSSLAGLAVSSIGLTCLFALTLWLGERLARGDHPPVSLVTLMRHFAPTILPIALAYHMSHFFITFLVDGQYLLAAMGDPLANGANIFGLGQTRITTGFLNTPQSVKAIWLTQAGIVVTGHILAVLLSHHVALTLFHSPRRAALSQAPIALFMIGYTFFGLWLLAAPRGI